MGKSRNHNYPPTELLYNKVKDELSAWDINTEAIASDLRITKIARFNPHGQSYKVLSFRSYCYFDYDLITEEVEVLIKEHKCLKSGDTIPTIHSQVPRLGTPSQVIISFFENLYLVVESSPKDKLQSNMTRSLT